MPTELVEKKNTDQESLSNFNKTYDKWHEILKKNIPEAVSDPITLRLKLANRGKTDIHEWSIIMHLNIEPGAYLSKKFNTTGEHLTYEIKSSGSHHYIPAGSEIIVPVAYANNFPKALFDWTIEYKDVRSVDYVIFGGDKQYKHINALANPVGEATAKSA